MPARERDRRSVCPVACALDVVGDRWTLLVVRDLLRGKRRYGELLDCAERVPTNILADRLRRLEDEGLVERVLYSEHPPRAEYRLTPRGESLGPVVDALYAWGAAHVSAPGPGAAGSTPRLPAAPPGGAGGAPDVRPPAPGPAPRLRPAG